MLFQSIKSLNSNVETNSYLDTQGVSSSHIFHLGLANIQKSPIPSGLIYKKYLTFLIHCMNDVFDLYSRLDTLITLILLISSFSENISRNYNFIFHFQTLLSVTT